MTETARKGMTGKNKKDLSASRSLLSYCSTPINSVSSRRQSLMTDARIKKMTSNSLEKLPTISEKDDNNFENYQLEYNTYLLRKIQGRILLNDKEEKEENVKKCFVSLKWELEELLKKNVRLRTEIGYYKMLFEILQESNQKIEDGRKILEIFKENDIENLMKSLLNSLDYTINHLQLAGIDKSVIDEIFNNKIWGSESEIVEYLKKIYSFINKDKDEVSKIAAELTEIKKLSLENAVLRERFYSAFEKISNEILENNYKKFTNIVKTAFIQRTECQSDFKSNNLECDLEFLDFGTKLLNYK